MRSELLLSFFLLLPVVAMAQIGVYAEPDVNVTCNTIYRASPADVYIIVTGDWRGARFSIPPTDTSVIALEFCPLNGTTATGNFDQGFDLTFPACTSDYQVVARLTVIGVGPLCSEFALSPHPSATTGSVELTDCAGHTVAATWTPKILLVDLYGDHCYDVTRISPPPRNPFPADGAIDAPLSMTVSWTLDLPVGGCGLLGVQHGSLYLGTSVPPPLIAHDFDESHFPVGPLAPGTTYYWKVRVSNFGVPTESPLWSFRTLAPVAVERTTWGRVKALYR